MEYVGGFVSMEALATRLPILTVYADGRVFTEGPRIERDPAPALTDLQLQHISPADVDRLVHLALTAGVGSATDFGQPLITDAASTRFTVRGAAGAQTTTVYALNDSDATTSGVNAKQRAARAGLQSLYKSLSDLPATLGAGALSRAQPYQPLAVAVIARTWFADPQFPGGPKDIAWSGPALPGGQAVGPGETCVVVTGSDAVTRVLSAARSANWATPWTSGGKRWALAFRPLLPDESSCDSRAHED